MTSLMKRSLAAVGMAPARQLESVTEELRLATKRLQKLEERLRETREEAAGWKQRHDATANRHVEQQAAAERAEKRAERAEAQAAEWKARAQELSSEVRDLKDKLRETQRRRHCRPRVSDGHGDEAGSHRGRDPGARRAHARPRSGRVVTAPALSIVVTGRNDQYGGDFNERFFTALRFNHERLASRGVACEVILVEWNPVPGKPYLAELLSREFPALAASTLKRYVVAPEYHVAFTQNPQLGYLEYVAKNVGIRRASAPFVLVTNTDVLLGRQVVEAIAGGLPPGTIQRAARYDIKLGIDQSHLTWDALEDSANHVRQPVLKPPLFSGGSGDFVLTRSGDAGTGCAATTRSIARRVSASI